MLRPYSQPRLTPITDPARIAELDRGFGFTRGESMRDASTATCDGCEIEIIAVTEHQPGFRVTVRSPGGLEVESVLCSDCMLKARHARREALSPPMSSVVWRCHGCGEYRDDEWISVAHRKVELPPLRQVVQLNGRYCNDRVECLKKCADWLDEQAVTLSQFVTYGRKDR